MEWRSLWDYRTLHAQSVVKWCEQNVELLLRVPISRITVGDETLVHLAAASMAIADFPLLIQDALRYHFKKMLLFKTKGPLTIDAAIEMATMACDRAHNKVFLQVARTQWSRRGTPFIPSYQHPDMVLPRPCFIQREDPLQFPSREPPKGASHFHGRWVQFQNHGPAWMAHSDVTDDHRWFILPPNVPQWQNHWEGKPTPYGGTIKSVDHARAIVAEMRSYFTLPFDPSNPLNPAPIDPGKQHGHPNAVDGDALATSVVRLDPSDGDRTPYRRGISMYGKYYHQGDGLPVDDVLSGNYQGKREARELSCTRPKCLSPKNRLLGGPTSTRRLIWSRPIEYQTHLW